MINLLEQDVLSFVLLATILLFIVLLLLGFLLGGLVGAPWVPARQKDLEQMLDDAGLKSGQLLIELGCGDGRFLSQAAKRGARAIGYEINPLMWLIAWLRNLKNKNVQVHLGSFWKKNLADADAVMTFLMPKFMSRLEKKLDNELKPGAVFISYIFKLPNRKPSLKRRRWITYDF